MLVGSCCLTSPSHQISKWTAYVATQSHSVLLIPYSISAPPPPPPLLSLSDHNIHTPTRPHNQQAGLAIK